MAWQEALRNHEQNETYWHCRYVRDGVKGPSIGACPLVDPLAPFPFSRKC